jgi:hypothetical protein
MNICLEDRRSAVAVKIPIRFMFLLAMVRAGARISAIHSTDSDDRNRFVCLISADARGMRIKGCFAVNQEPILVMSVG